MITQQSKILLLGFLEQLIGQSKLEVERFKQLREEEKILEGDTDYLMAQYNLQTLERMHSFFKSGEQLETIDYVLAWGHLSQLLDTCSDEERPLVKAVMKELRAEVEGSEEDKK